MLNWLSFLFTSLKMFLFLPKFRGICPSEIVEIQKNILHIWGVWLHDINNKVKEKKVPLMNINQLEQFLGIYREYNFFS